MTTEPISDPADEFDLVHARILHFFPELVTELGGDPGLLMRRAGMPSLESPVHESPEGRPGATYRQMVHLLELTGAELHCPDFGMRLAERQGGLMFGPLGMVMRNSRTFSEALDYVCNHAYAHSLAARIRLKRLPQDNSVFVSHDILLEGLPRRSQAMEQILLVGHITAMEMTGGHARAQRILFRHQPVSPAGTYRRHFGCEVRFGQHEDGVVYSERSLKSAIVDSDAAAYRAVTAYIDRKFTRHRPPLHAEARGAIMQFLGTDLCTNQQIAAELGLHPRTLHRRLSSEGTSFQQIKDEVRRDLMLYYIHETDLDFADISERLGFAEQSVMTRNCNRWFAISPRGLRARQRHIAAVG